MPLDQKTVRHVVHGQFPEVPCADVEQLGEGMDCWAWLIDGRCVFRFPKREAGAECLQNEIRILPEIAERLPVRVSAPRWIGNPTREFAWPFAGYRLVAGRSVCDVDLPDSAAPEFGRALARFLQALHSISEEDAREFDAPADEWRRLDVPHRCEFARERLQQAQSLGLIPDAGAWLSRLDEFDAPLPTLAPRSLVHGDLYSKHVLVDDDFQLAGIIDWGDVHFGQPAVDLAAFWNVVPAAGRAAFLDEYGPVDRTTWRLAELRAIYHSVTVLLFANEIADEPLAARSRLALQAVLERPDTN